MTREWSYAHYHAQSHKHFPWASCDIFGDADLLKPKMDLMFRRQADAILVQRALHDVEGFVTHHSPVPWRCVSMPGWNEIRDCDDAVIALARTQAIGQHVAHRVELLFWKGKHPEGYDLPTSGVKEYGPRSNA